MKTLVNFFIILILSIFISYKASAYTVKESDITKICKMYEYKDCAMVHSIIKIESGYESKAQNVDCLGLMQMKCSTAQFLGLADCKNLFNPRTSIAFGIKYLKYLEELLNTDNKEDLLSAYNAGYILKNNKYLPKRKNGKYINEKYISDVFKVYFSRPEILAKLGVERL